MEEIMDDRSSPKGAVADLDIARIVGKRYPATTLGDLEDGNQLASEYRNVQHINDLEG